MTRNAALFVRINDDTKWDLVSKLAKYRLNQSEFLQSVINNFLFATDKKSLEFWDNLLSQYKKNDT